MIPRGLSYSFCGCAIDSCRYQYFPNFWPLSALYSYIRPNPVWKDWLSMYCMGGEL